MICCIHICDSPERFVLGIDLIWRENDERLKLHDQCRWRLQWENVFMLIRAVPILLFTCVAIFITVFTHYWVQMYFGLRTNCLCLRFAAFLSAWKRLFLQQNVSSSGKNLFREFKRMLGRNMMQVTKATLCS